MEANPQRVPYPCPFSTSQFLPNFIPSSLFHSFFFFPPHPFHTLSQINFFQLHLDVAIIVYYTLKVSNVENDWDAAAYQVSSSYPEPRLPVYLLANSAPTHLGPSLTSCLGAEMSSRRGSQNSNQRGVTSQCLILWLLLMRLPAQRQTNLQSRDEKHGMVWQTLMVSSRVSQANLFEGPNQVLAGHAVGEIPA